MQAHADDVRMSFPGANHDAQVPLTDGKGVGGLTPETHPTAVPIESSCDERMQLLCPVAAAWDMNCSPRSWRRDGRSKKDAFGSSPRLICTPKLMLTYQVTLLTSSLHVACAQQLRRSLCQSGATGLPPVSQACSFDVLLTDRDNEALAPLPTRLDALSRVFVPFRSARNGWYTAQAWRLECVEMQLWRGAPLIGR